MRTIVLNLFGEPSSGKSTAAMDITARLKRRGVNAEYVSEFAKDKVYENNNEVFRHQEYIFGKQSFKMGRVNGKVQVIVVDSPLLLCAVYHDGRLGKEFNRTVLNAFSLYENRNYLLTRKHAYEKEGRFQDEDGAMEVRDRIIRALADMNVPYCFATSGENDCEEIAEKIEKEIKGNEQ